MAPPAVVEIRRSDRRRRMVSARREGDTVIVFIPGWMSESEEHRWVDEMVRRLARSEARRRSPARTGDDALMRRSAELSRRYLDGLATPTTVRWVPPMRTRWASCTPADATIRISERLRDVPGWVVDYVLVHELTHLLEPGHDERFWAWVHHYPRAERAMGYLEGLSAAAGLGLVGIDGDRNDADLDGPDPTGTDLPGTDLTGTDLPGADLYGADGDPTGCQSCGRPGPSGPF